jgi:hypothetical protein
MIVFAIIEIGIAILMFAGLWKMFTKAGQPGWAAIVPIYNFYVMLKIAGRPGWWLILAFIPFVNLITLVIPFDIAKKFGQGTAFGFGLLLLGFIFYPILGFGAAQYMPEPAERRGFQVIPGT